MLHRIGEILANLENRLVSAGHHDLAIKVAHVVIAEGPAHTIAELVNSRIEALIAEAYQAQLDLESEGDAGRSEDIEARVEEIKVAKDLYLQETTPENIKDLMSALKEGIVNPTTWKNAFNPLKNLNPVWQYHMAQEQLKIGEINKLLEKQLVKLQKDVARQNYQRRTQQNQPDNTLEAQFAKLSQELDRMQQRAELMANQNDKLEKGINELFSNVAANPAIKEFYTYEAWQKQGLLDEKFEARLKILIPKVQEIIENVGTELSSIAQGNAPYSGFEKPEDT